MLPRKYSLKFWIIFVSIYIAFIAGWYLFSQIHNKKYETLGTLVNLLTWDKKEAQVLEDLAKHFMQENNQEKTFLILFQNNMELRPGGGYIGSFGILKVKNGKITKMETHDTSNFDERIPDGITPPYPIKETLKVLSWKLRDSNFSPDFLVNAQKAEEFYKIGKGEETFDGIFAVNANVLTSFLKVTGPIEIPGFPGKYSSENALVDLEYQVEKAFYGQNINVRQRKEILGLFGKEIIKKVFSLGLMEKAKLAEIILQDLKSKDIQLYFRDTQLQKEIAGIGWSGTVDQEWQKDYLMIADANLGAFKSDRVIKRSMEYFVDFSKETPEAVLKITYDHTAKEKDWMTKDYLTFLRVYAPEGSWLTDKMNVDNPVFGKELGKQYFGFLVKVPLGQTKTIELTYKISDKIDAENYQLKIQKQSGVGEIPTKVTIKEKNGEIKKSEFSLMAEEVVDNKK
jgi:hypothetical protein